MEINKEEAKLILESILATPVQTTIKGLMGRVSFDDVLTNLINKLKKELEEKHPGEPVTDFDQPYNV